MFKKILRTTSLYTAVLLLAITASSLKPITAHAESLTIIPPRFDLFGNPGDTIAEKVRVRNDSPVDVSYSVETENFVARGDDGGVNFVPDEESNDLYALAKWITVEPKNFTLKQDEERIVNVQIKIPKGGEPGGHYASVLVKRGGQETPGGAAVDSRVGSLILLRVSGNTTEKASVTSFAAEESFSQKTPVTFDLHMQNDGNVHVAPQGTIVITNMFGKKVREIPLNSANVLPGSQRVMKTVLDDQHLVGRYTATLVATYGQQKQTLSATANFIVFPLYILWFGLGAIAVLALLITQRKKFKRLINRLTSD